MKKEDFLTSIIQKIVGVPCGYPHSKLTIEEIERAGLDKEVLRVYQKLGGKLDSFPINYRWDITYSKFIIELDEELHFNRYRYDTLQSVVYRDCKNFIVDNYQRYCQLYEDTCLKAGSYGGKWKNSSTENQFPGSNIDGILEGGGSSRWKQRAFYDYLKDVHSIIRGIPVIRISIYDKFDNESLNSLLSNSKKEKVTDFCKDLLKQHDIL